MTITSGLFTFAIILIPFAVAIFCSRAEHIKIFFISLLYIYSLYLFKYAVFPIYLSDTMKAAMQFDSDAALSFGKNLNLIPFLKNFYPMDFMLNIIMTLPLGILAPCVKKDIKLGSFCILTGIILELNQFLLALIQGFTFRDININDSIANALGVFIGHLIFKISVGVLLKVPRERMPSLFLSFREYFEDAV